MQLAAVLASPPRLPAPRLFKPLHSAADLHVGASDKEPGARDNLGLRTRQREAARLREGARGYAFVLLLQVLEHLGQ